MVAWNPGDTLLYDCTMSGAGGGVDVRQRVYDLAVYESITKPYISVVLTLIDPTDLLNGLFDGNNSFSLSFSQPGQEPYTGQFTVMSAEKVRNLQNQRVATYKVVGYSPHMTNFPMVQKAYRTQTATSVASDLINSFLKPIKPLQVRAPSVGMVGNQHMPYNINNIQIHAAIRSTLLRAMSSKDKSSAYTFFENKRALVIDTLENMINNVGGGPTFYQRPLGRNFLTDTAFQQWTIISLREDSRKDSVQTVQNQSIATNVLDLFSNAFKAGSGGGGGSGSSRTFAVGPYNSLRPPAFFSQFMSQRAKVAGQFDSQSVTVHVPLHTELTVGDGFSVQTLAPAGELETATPDSIAGNLLAAEVCHRVNFSQRRMMGTSTIRGVKGTIT